MPDRTVSNSTASVSDTGVSVVLRMSSTDLASLIRYGTVTLDQTSRVVPIGAVHVGRITVDLI